MQNTIDVQEHNWPRTATLAHLKQTGRHGRWGGNLFAEGFVEGKRQQGRLQLASASTIGTEPELLQDWKLCCDKGFHNGLLSIPRWLARARPNLWPGSSRRRRRPPSASERLHVFFGAHPLAKDLQSFQSLVHVQEFLLGDWHEIFRLESFGGRSGLFSLGREQQMTTVPSCCCIPACDADQRSVELAALLTGEPRDFAEVVEAKGKWAKSKTLGDQFQVLLLQSEQSISNEHFNACALVALWPALHRAAPAIEGLSDF
mmetsp:Transcript_65775/g.142753  ORF Transcript_65775/g.142753 Transcript_65775/m.142753 type:complete len:259 (-) Transcript_65775:85-861(-)